MRKKLIERFTARDRNGAYKEFKNCLNSTGDIDNIDNFFKGVISSLHYRVNPVILALVGPQEIGKTQLFRKLFSPDIQKGYYENVYLPIDKNKLYTNLILDVDLNFSYEDLKKLVKMGQSDAFDIIDGTPEKRLASFVVTSNVWDFPPRKNVCLINLKNIDIETFNLLDKEDLWSDIYHTFYRDYSQVERNKFM